MSAVKHTPGLWVVSSPGFVRTGAGAPIAAVYPVPDDHDVFNESATANEREANTRLIAAAPDLLECVTELKELFRFALLSTTPEIAREGMPFITKAEAAIAKATTPSPNGETE